MGDEITVEQALEALSGSGKKYVPESDLIAAKKGLEGQLATVQADLATARTEADTKHQDVLRLQAAVTAAEAKLSGTQASKEELAELKKQLKEATEGRDALGNQLIGLRRLAIHQKSGIEMKVLETKTAEQLAALEEALQLVKPGDNHQTFDSGGGGGGTGPKASGRQMIKEGLAAKG